MRIRALSVLAASIAASLLAAGVANADTTTVRVDENGDGGWAFNPDPANATPYEFSTAEQSIGAGSLFVQPLSSTIGARKFIGAKELGMPVADIASLSYDFHVATSGVAANPYKQFYLNVYTNLPASTTFFDCRFDYVPTSGATGTWTSMNVTPATTPTSVGDRPADSFTCPATLGGMPAGSTVRAIALNVGDTSTNDGGVSGYLDNVGVATADGNSTVYDFEAKPADKDACKKGGWAEYGFDNQGACVSYLQANENAGK